MNEPHQQVEGKPENPPKLFNFVGLVFLWLIPCFIIWVSLSSLLAAPAVWLADWILTSSLPGFVHELSISGPKALLATNFGELDGKIVAAEVAGYRLAYPLDTRILSYSIPFYAALHFATQTSGGASGNSMSGFVTGLAVLYPLLVLGVISVCIKNLMLGLGPVFIDGNGALAAITGLGYQLSVLIIPSLVPVLVWAWQSRENPLLLQLLQNTTRVN